MTIGSPLTHRTTGDTVHYVGTRSNGLITVRLPNGRVVAGKPSNYRRVPQVRNERAPAHDHDPAIVAHWMQATRLSERHVVNELNAMRRDGTA